jgi:hypothetical protein
VPRSPNWVPGVEQGGLFGREQPAAQDRPAGIVETQQAVRLDDAAMRPDPGGMAAAAGEIPAAADPVATWHRDRFRLVRRTPGDRGARIAPDCPRNLRRKIGRDQPGRVGDRNAPAYRAVGPRQFLERQHIGAGLDLVAVDRARQQHAEEARLVQRIQKGHGQSPGPLDLIGGGFDRRGEIACPRQRVPR